VPPPTITYKNSTNEISADYALDLAVVGAAVAVLLGVVAVVARRRPPRSGASDVPPPSANSPPPTEPPEGPDPASPGSGSGP